MYLLIDNTIDGQVVFYYSLNTEWVQRVFQPVQDGRLLYYLDRLLFELGIKKGQLQGLAVRVGQGRFTGTRVAVTVANTLALAEQIPVVGVIGPGTADLKEIIQSAPVGQYVSAKYSGEAKIGRRKK